MYNYANIDFPPPDPHPHTQSHIGSEVTKLKTEVEQLRKEKADLLGEVEAHKLRVRSSHVIYHMYTFLSKRNSINLNLTGRDVISIQSHS